MRGYAAPPLAEGTNSHKLALMTYFDSLIRDLKSVTDRLNLQSDQADELRQLFIDKCRQQYLMGNKAGVTWAQEHPQK